MKKLLLAALLCLPLVSKAQNTNIDTVLTFLGTESTNWYAGGGILYDYDSHHIGGRVGLGYSLFDGITVPELAIEYFDSALYMVSGQISIGPPQKWLGKFPIRPFAEVGSKIPISGLGGSNGDPIAFTGGGVTARLSKHFLLLFAVEYRFTGDHKGTQFLAGPVYNF